MVPKGPGCVGCPYESDGDWMVPDEENKGQSVILLAQNPGKAEERGQKFVRWAGGGGEIWEPHPPAPLIGKSGWQVTNVFLPLANLTRDSVRCGNVVRCRRHGTDDLPPIMQRTVRDAIRHCQTAYFTPPPEGGVIVALGSHALWAVTGESGANDEDNDDDSRASHSIAGWRGWALPYRPQWGTTSSSSVTVFATYHPAFYYRAHWLKPVGKMDFQRLGRYLKGTWPEPFPEVFTNVPITWPEVLSFDTEYQPWVGGNLIRMSAAWRNELGTPTVHVIEAADCRTREAPRRVIMHNAEADWPYLMACFGAERVEWEDTMYAHSVLYGTWRHTLDFLGSLYARTNRWKHLEQSDPLRYSGLDALATWDVWVALERELSGDPDSMEIYQSELKPLLPHLLRRPAIRLDAQRVTEHTTDLKRQQREVAKRGQAAAGWPLSVSSASQVANWIGVKRAQSASAGIRGVSSPSRLVKAKS